ncbi:hypothetical protein MPTK1_2g13850 [Marchantia polymorpha subsp. ruderalis]|uniref:Tetratricopeptide repeat protein 38 n=1 Tax=Marchantia polymorpha TaxID=3197 RepID=A0A2R6X1H1_MARPO|nr:hypothetical protein MARPO_0042s0014 [Marchantia polymorpha]BBN02244.1 hypothetical protein Mp_2g13850 [Marchantia polymorpha subsp. ruderalis]PTQ39950.1 hypothetical protein MARPO_0042s0014 [Marchantia polymorpha]PTQ39951.1 hypothetical protein MARPO_0042s0014 [Marchantia polymorpha]PTQ39952.1 hypothetical protein MARPO_0042s0014 [Marchantia polymorpha]|eukprot:PTQ39946.1 hypothetical protein MARPO_0042s0014 [Marchantia polymorpha]
MASSSVEKPDPAISYKNDLWGYEVRSSSDDCITFLNKYYIEVLSYGRDKRVILQAADADNCCALACGLAAVYLWAPQKSTTLPPRALIYLTAAKENLVKASKYEELVVRALVAWIEHGSEDALARHFEVLESYPRDLLTLKRGQTLCFNMGRSADMLRLALKALPFNVERGYVFGMLAFALVEVGSIREGESAARMALTIEAQDIWAQHALCHALEYQCRFKEALTLMNISCSSWLTRCSFMREHNWWHVAACQLELGGRSALKTVLYIYDEHIWGSQRVIKNPQTYINALGLLLRMEIRVDSSIVQERILQVVSSLKERAFEHQELLLDLLAIWAFGRADQPEEAIEMAESVKSKVLAVDVHKPSTMQCVISLAAALCECGRGNLKAVAEILGSTFYTGNLKVLGASNEQLDVFEDLWCISSLRAGHVTQVVEVAERLTREKPGISFAWRVLEEAYSKSGQAPEAIFAGSRARVLELAGEEELLNMSSLYL